MTDGSKTTLLFQNEILRRQLRQELEKRSVGEIQAHLLTLTVESLHFEDTIEGALQKQVFETRMSHNLITLRDSISDEEVLKTMLIQMIEMATTIQSLKSKLMKTQEEN